MHLPGSGPVSCRIGNNSGGQSLPNLGRAYSSGLLQACQVVECNPGAINLPIQNHMFESVIRLQTAALGVPRQLPLTEVPLFEVDPFECKGCLERVSQKVSV